MLNDPTRIADATIDGGRVELRQGQALVVYLDTNRRAPVCAGT